jgi:hypothetical protein
MPRCSASVIALTVLTLLTLLAGCSPLAGVSVPETGYQSGAAERGGATAFVPVNAEVADAAFLFRSLGSAATLFFGADGVSFPVPCAGAAKGLFDGLLQEETPEPGTLAAVRLQFVDANASAQVIGQEPLPGVVNYFLGDDPARWQSGVPTFARLAYEDLYPGIDLLYDGSEGALKGAYVVAPGANPGNIRWRYEGAPGVKLSKGELWVGVTSAGGAPLLVERRPVAWQTQDGNRKPVSVRYVVHRDGSIGFRLGRYDADLPLIIDPTLDYATYWGEGGCDFAIDLAVDSDNDVYVTGTTNSLNVPPPSPEPDCTVRYPYDVFVIKLDPSQTGASQLVYTTYIGGNGVDRPNGIALDSSGYIDLAGRTWSLDFPTTPNAWQQNLPDGDFINGFVARLDDTGAVQYASYLGGTDGDEVMQVATDDGDQMFVAGYTDSDDFPTTADAYQEDMPDRDAFVAVLDPTQSGAASLVYSSYFGGSGKDQGYGLTMRNGIIDFIGTSLSDDLPLKNPIQATNHGGSGSGDGFVARLDPSRSGDDQLLFATYLGGSGNELPGGIAADDSGNLTVAGVTWSTDFATTVVSPPYGGGDSDAFLAKLDTTAPTSLVYSRFVGGKGSDGLGRIALDDADNVYAVGGTGSGDVQTVHPIQGTFKGGTDPAEFSYLGPGDVWIAAFDNTGAMTFGTYYGGTGAEGAVSLRLGADGRAYVTGTTRSADLETVNPYQDAYAGTYDGFVAIIGDLALPPLYRHYLPIVLRNSP